MNFRGRQVVKRLVSTCSLVAIAFLANNLRAADLSVFHEATIVSNSHPKAIAQTTNNSFVLAGRAYALFANKNGAISGGYPGSPFSISPCGNAFSRYLRADFARIAISPDSHVILCGRLNSNAPGISEAGLATHFHRNGVVLQELERSPSDLGEAASCGGFSRVEHTRTVPLRASRRFAQI